MRYSWDFGDGTTGTGLDTDGRVLYMGTFSKVLYPGLKLGYLVVPKPQVARCIMASFADVEHAGDAVAALIAAACRPHTTLPVEVQSQSTS